MIFGAIVAAAMILVVFIDSFETMILPRRVRHSYRLTRIYYLTVWSLWRMVSKWLPHRRTRLSFLSIFGPLSLLGLVVVWATGLIVSFALLHWCLETSLIFSGQPVDSLTGYLYFSGTTFFTLGYGDLVPNLPGGRLLSVVEAGIGFGFLAMIISYFPVLYQAFSRREITISMLDARAGSPPTAGELLTRLGKSKSLQSSTSLLAAWEIWCAELLESHLSYPVLSYYRSQHDNQSWLSTLTLILDTSALMITGVDGSDGHQARLTFAMARHAAVDLGLVFNKPPMNSRTDRVSPGELDRLLQKLKEVGIPIRDQAEVARSLNELRNLYEPFVTALADYFQFELPPFLPPQSPMDNWRTSPWAPPSPDLGCLPAPAKTVEEHYH